MLATSQDTIELSPALAEIALQEFGETNEARSQAILQLRERIAALPNEDDRLVDTSDINLIRFIRSRKYNLDRALDCTIKYQHFLKKHHHQVHNITAEEIRLFKDAMIVIEEEGDDGRVIAYVRVKKVIEQHDELKSIPHFLLRIRYFLFERISYNPRAQICGILLIFSAQELSLWDQMTLPKLSPVSDHQAAMEHFQLLGTRFKGAFILNEPSFLTWLWYIIQHVLSEKIRSRFRLCGRNHQPMRDAVKDLSILPKLLGGPKEDDDPVFSQWLYRQVELLSNECSS